MNRFIIIDGLPYLIANKAAHSVRWDEDGFTVGEKVDKTFSPHPLLTEKEVMAKCAVLDSIGAVHNEEMTLANDEVNEDSEAKEEQSIEEMTLAELKEYATVHEIDLNGARTKPAIIKAIFSAEGKNAE